MRIVPIDLTFSLSYLPILHFTLHRTLCFAMYYSFLRESNF